MTVHDLTTNSYSSFPAKTKLDVCSIISRRFIGTDLTSPIAGSTPVDGDSFKIAKISKHQMINRVWTVVTDADGDAITLDIGYTDGTNTSATAFETDAALNSTGVTESADDKIFFDDDGYFLTITPSSLSTLDDATEFTVCAEVIDMGRAGITEALTAPV